MQVEQKTQVQAPQPSLENLTRQNLIAVISEKVKEVKTLTTKNSKLESKYIATYKEQKLFKKDYDTFVKFIKSIMPQYEQKALGSHQTAELDSIWSRKEKQSSQKMKKLNQDLSNEKVLLQNQYKTNYETKILQMQGKWKATHSALGKQNKELIEEIEKLRNDISFMQERLNAKDEQIKKIINDKIKVEHELNSIKVNTVKSELDFNLNAFNNNDKESDIRTELLIVRQELDASLEKIEELKQNINNLQTKVRNKNKQIEYLKQQHESKNNENNNVVFTHQNNHQKHNGQAIKVKKQEKTEKQLFEESHSNFGFKDQIPLSRKEEKSQYFQKQYLKNIFLRYMKSLSQNNQSQGEILENILMTILEFGPKEREITAIRRRKWWNFFK